MRKKRSKMLTMFMALSCVVMFGTILGFGPCDWIKHYTTDFRLEDCDGFSSIGSNPYFILEPGYQLVLEGEEDGEDVVVEITVLEETEEIATDFGPVTARVVEERESVDEALVEVSRNFFAICNRTNDVIYFGEDVTICEDGFNEEETACENGEDPDDDGAWKAGEEDAQPGLIMPGTFLVGSRYYQEIAPDVALDRATNMLTGQTFEPPAGPFDDCVVVFETTPLEPGEKSVKVYCAGVGLVFDDGLELTEIVEP